METPTALPGQHLFSVLWMVHDLETGTSSPEFAVVVSAEDTDHAIAKSHTLANTDAFAELEGRIDVELRGCSKVIGT